MKRINQLAVGLIVLLFIPGTVFSQKMKLNDGFAPISILAPSKKLIPYMREVPSNKLWDKIYADGFILGTYIFDIDKAKQRTFFGQPVERIEVQTTWGYNEITDEEYKSVFQFTLFVPMPKDHNKYLRFIQNVVNNYGSVRSFTIHENDVESPNWFNNITMLTVFDEDAAIDVNGKKYIPVQFRQAFGG